MRDNETHLPKNPKEKEKEREREWMREWNNFQMTVLPSKELVKGIQKQNSQFKFTQRF